MKKISIITPCYNEEEGLIECTERISQLFANELKNYDYEHIICDNNSDEKTVSILRKISSNNKNVKIILNAKNYGSVKSTFNGIKNSSGDAVLLFFPVDMQDPPEKIPDLVKKMYPHIDKRLIKAAGRSVLAHLLYMQDLGYVKSSNSPNGKGWVLL